GGDPREARSADRARQAPPPLQRLRGGHRPDHRRRGLPLRRALGGRRAPARGSARAAAHPDRPRGLRARLPPRVGRARGAEPGGGRRARPRRRAADPDRAHAADPDRSSGPGGHRGPLHAAGELPGTLRPRGAQRVHGGRPADLSPDRGARGARGDGSPDRPGLRGRHRLEDPTAARAGLSENRRAAHRRAGPQDVGGSLASRASSVMTPATVSTAPSAAAITTTGRVASRSAAPSGAAAAVSTSATTTPEPTTASHWRACAAMTEGPRNAPPTRLPRWTRARRSTRVAPSAIGMRESAADPAPPTASATVASQATGGVDGRTASGSAARTARSTSAARRIIRPVRGGDATVA